MSNYEQAPATKMLATNCAICSRPLLDSLSVETGMGPHCRQVHGYSGKNAPQVSDEDRKKANKIVYAIALGLDAGTLACAITELRGLGFSLLAGVLEDRKVAVHIEGHDITSYKVRTPWNQACYDANAWRLVPGQRWERDSKARIVPCTDEARKALWGLLRQFYGGELMKSNKGLVQIPFDTTQHNTRYNEP
jgi:Family of unknown function (DUF6011)